MFTNQWHIDQMGNRVSLSNEPLRIVSLVPSQTELLYDFGLTNEVVGQTLFCIHPNEMHLVKPRIGGTKKLDINKIRALNPTLIIGNKEENTREHIEELQKEFPVWMSDIQNLDQAIDMIEKLGTMLDKRIRAQEIIQQILGGFKDLVQTERKIKCLYLIWREPWMAAGKDTFIDDLLQKMGFDNVAKMEESRYPAFDGSTMEKWNPEVILLSSEPYPFKEKHLMELRIICPHAKLKLVDGELFSWYGSRLINSGNYLKNLQAELL